MKINKAEKISYEILCWKIWLRTLYTVSYWDTKEFMCTSGIRFKLSLGVNQNQLLRNED